MVSDREMRKILTFSTPYILQNLASLDFLNNNVQKVDGKLPFYDDMSQFAAVSSKKGKKEYVSKRQAIHLKDSWTLRFTSSRGIGTVRLSNAKKSGDGRWNVADLLWDGTRDYNINAPDTTIRVPILYRDVTTAAGRAQGWQGLTKAFKEANKYKGIGTTVPQTIRGHHTGTMSFYNRYTGQMNWNRHFRRGIRNELVTSFRQFILLCVENGIRTGLQTMETEGILRAKITNVSVRIV
jgi:hypothetical protein